MAYASTKVACDRCPFEREVFHELSRYATEGGERVHVQSVLGWCDACGTMTEVEDVPSPRDIEERIRRIVAGESMALRARGGPTRDVLLAWVEARRRWRAGRVAPPKCLTCGSAAIRPMSAGKDRFLPHPGCPGGGTITVRGHGFPNERSIDPNDDGIQWYTPEGDRLPTRPHDHG